jgi:acyl carrier protein
MKDSSEVAAVLRELVQARAARAIGSGDFTSDVGLGADGLGLDSIAIAEVLLACEERFGVDTLPLLTEQKLTLARLAAHIDRGVAS